MSSNFYDEIFEQLPIFGTDEFKMVCAASYGIYSSDM